MDAGIEDGGKKGRVQEKESSIHCTPSCCPFFESREENEDR